MWFKGPGGNIHLKLRTDIAYDAAPLDKGGCGAWGGEVGVSRPIAPKESQGGRFDVDWGERGNNPRYKPVCRMRKLKAFLKIVRGDI